jgi:glycosyltransferase involved in cell wall biosynthesis
MLSPWSRTQGRWFNRLGKWIYLATRARRNLDRAAAIHFTTTTERDLVAEMNFAAPALVEPVGIDLAEFESLPPRGSFRARDRQIGERPMVLFLSRLSPQKGIDRLIPAFADVVRAGSSDAVLVLAGPDYDGYERAVKAMIAEHGVGERVIFTGMLMGPDRIEALCDADVFVLPSHHENFGIVVAEAMAAAAPVIVSRAVNVWPDVAAAQAGAVVSGERAELAAEISRWLADPAKRQAAGERGRAFARAHYDWGHIARHWVDHYARLARPHAQADAGGSSWR